MHRLAFVLAFLVAGPVSAASIQVPVFLTTVDPDSVISDGGLAAGQVGTFSFDVSDDLVAVDAPDGISARFVLPSGVGSFLADLSTDTGRAFIGTNVIPEPGLPNVVIDIVDGPVRSLTINAFDFDGSVTLGLLDPFRSTLLFGDLSSPQTALAAISGPLRGLAGSLSLLDQANARIEGLVLQSGAPVTQPVPEPASVALLLVGAGVVAMSVRRRSKGQG